MQLSLKSHPSNRWHQFYWKFHFLLYNKPPWRKSAFFLSENLPDRSTNNCISTFPPNYFQIPANSVATNQLIHQSTPKIGISSPAFSHNFPLCGRPGKRNAIPRPIIGRVVDPPPWNVILKETLGPVKWRLRKWQAPQSLSGLLLCSIHADNDNDPW